MSSKQLGAYIVCVLSAACAWYVHTMVMSLYLLSMQVTFNCHLCAQSVQSSLSHKSPVACAQKRAVCVCHTQHENPVA